MKEQTLVNIVVVHEKLETTMNRQDTFMPAINKEGAIGDEGGGLI